MKLSELLNTALPSLELAGVDTPRLDAEVLLAHVMGIKRSDLILHKHDLLDPEKEAAFGHLIDQRTLRKPVSQIINSKEFWTRKLYVDENVLTPRPETEGIIERAAKLFPADASIDILDIGTGSGCIAAALADVFPNAKITATDISPTALEVARRNLAFASDRCEFLCGDLFDAFEPTYERTNVRTYDLIVSNPPYIPENEFRLLEPDVRDHEPRIALTPGTDGLAFFRQIAKDAAHHLKNNGWLVMEMGLGQSVEVGKIIETVGVYHRITIDKDLAGIERIIAAQKTCEQ